MPPAPIGIGVAGRVEHHPDPFRVSIGWLPGSLAGSLTIGEIVSWRPGIEDVARSIGGQALGRQPDLRPPRVRGAGLGGVGGGGGGRRPLGPPMRTWDGEIATVGRAVDGRPTTLAVLRHEPGRPLDSAVPGRPSSSRRRMERRTRAMSYSGSSAVPSPQSTMPVTSRPSAYKAVGERLQESRVVEGAIAGWAVRAFAVASTSTSGNQAGFDKFAPALDATADCSQPRQVLHHVGHQCRHTDGAETSDANVMESRHLNGYIGEGWSRSEQWGASGFPRQEDSGWPVTLPSSSAAWITGTGACDRRRVCRPRARPRWRHRCRSWRTGNRRRSCSGPRAAEGSQRVHG